MCLLLMISCGYLVLRGAEVLSCKVLGDDFDLRLVVLFGVLYSLRRFVISRQASSIKFWGNWFLFQIVSLQGYLAPCSFL